MKSILFMILCLLSVMAIAVEPEKLRQKAGQIFSPLPEAPPIISDNPANPAKIELGAMLFFDPRLSRSGTISCSSCHNLAAGGADNISVSIGHGWQRGSRNAPTVLNSIYNIAQFWDGRAPDLESQAKAPLQAKIEMNNTPKRIVATLNSIPNYVERFANAFPDKEEPVSFDNVTKKPLRYLKRP